MISIGLGTSKFGLDARQFDLEVELVRQSIDAGVYLIDTAEMYASGRSEKIVGKALQGLRSEVYICSKVFGHNASKSMIRSSCYGSLRRLGIDYLDLYLLHNRGKVPLNEIIDSFERLVDDGLIGNWGVCNLSANEIKTLGQHSNCRNLLAHQFPFGLFHTPNCHEVLQETSRQGLVALAHSTFYGLNNANPLSLQKIARRYDASIHQVALSCTKSFGVLPVVGVSSSDHQEKCVAAMSISLKDDEIRELQGVSESSGLD